MAYNAQDELKKVKEYYEGDPLQKRFSALITGETNAGKTFLLRTARFPVHIDSFDPGGTKCLRDLIDKGDVVTDTSFEDDDPFTPTAFANWKRSVDRRFHVKYFHQFGTYCLDSATTFGMAVMADVLKSASREGEVPRYRHDYNPQKIAMVNYFRKLMNLPCDFILTGHLKTESLLLTTDSSTGVSKYSHKHRLHVTGDATITIPLLFDEIYVLRAEGKGGVDPKREIVTDALGEYIARSRLKGKGLLNAIEPPDIKALLKKAGFSTEDKPKLKEGE